MKYINILFLSCIFIFCIFLRFYNLNWGAPFYFHPDERNIANAVTGLDFPQQLNPHFFAYGSLPIYVIYLTSVIINIFHPTSAFSSSFNVSFPEAIIISRFFSALFSSLLILSLYIIGVKLKDKAMGIFCALLGATSIGLLQYAHFGTFEMWTAFWSLWYFFACFKIMQKTTFFRFAICGVLFGILIAIKISSISLIFIPFVAAFLQIRDRISYKKVLPKIFVKFIIFGICATIIIAMICPFFFLDFTSFQNSIRYESSVATGYLSVFYTREFVHTIPILFQLRFVFPFLLNPLILLFFIFSINYLFFLAYKKDKTALLLLVIFACSFFPSAFLFVKWTRYMVPILPIIYLCIGYVISNILRYSKIKKCARFFIFIVFSICLGYDFLYFFVVLKPQDTRIAAYNYAKAHIRPTAKILSENYDLGVLPFSPYYHTDLFNFYDLDTNPQQKNILIKRLKNYDYIILPSQRINRMRFIHPHTFPVSSGIYQQFFSGDMEYVKIYETPCDLFCKIFYAGNPISGYEETVNIFDRPTIYILKRKMNK